MKTKLLKYQLTFAIFFWFGTSAYSQYSILEDRGAITKVQQAIDSIYNLNFDAADAIIADLDGKLGDYPGILLLKAFYLSWKDRPIKKEHESFKLFESYLKQGIENSKDMLEEDKEDVEACFFMLACHAFLAELYVNNGLSLKALGEAKSAYKYIKIGFDHTEENPEFYFSSGIYNYYREKYPQENPFYKSFIWFFRSGDMEEGIKMLKTGSESAIFTKAECLTYLFHIYLRYEDNPQNAIIYARLLKDKYPNNLFYISNFIENSLRLEHYEEVQPYIKRLIGSDKKFHRYIGEIYFGMYLERKENNLSMAAEHYQKADELGAQDKMRIPHYDSMLYLGLGRIYKLSGQEDKAKHYLKKSMKSAEYSAYRKDAEQLLKN